MSETTANNIETPSTEELVAPIVRYARKTQELTDGAGEKITDIGQSINNKIRTLFSYDSPKTVTPEDGAIKGILKSPFQITGDALDGTIGNAARRTTEILEPAGEMVSGAAGTIKNLIIHPLTPSKYLIEGPLKLIKGFGKLLGNGLIKTPLAAIDEAVGGIIERPVERIKNAIDQVPVIGTVLKPLTWLANGIGKGLKWLTGSARNKINEAI